MRIEWNDEGFDQVIREAAERIQVEAQKVFDDVYRTHKGRPSEQVKPVLSRRWAEVGSGWNLVEPHLSSYANAISSEQKINVRVTSE